MPTYDRQRSRFNPPSPAELSKRLPKRYQFEPVNRDAHYAQHGMKKLSWTSTATLATTVSTPWYPPFSGRVISVSANVTGTGATDTILDLLLNGNSVFTSGFTNPTITAGTLVTPQPFLVSTGSFSPVGQADYWQFQITQTGGAVGPLVATLQFVTNPV